MGKSRKIISRTDIVNALCCFIEIILAKKTVLQELTLPVSYSLTATCIAKAKTRSNIWQGPVDF